MQLVFIVNRFDLMTYSKLRFVSAAMALDDGSICLWDTLQSSLYHHYKCVHTASAMTVAFSPINNLFMASVGIDKTIIMYDVNSKK